MNSPSEIGVVPIQGNAGGELLVRDVAEVREGTMPGEFDRYNMRRLVTITANIEGEDLGRVIRRVKQALTLAGEPPRGVEVDIRGQAVPMEQMFRGLTVGLALAMVVIVLLLAAYFQSLGLAVISASAIPAVIAGVAGALALTGTTLNLQSFMGTIMAIGVATANAILLLIVRRTRPTAWAVRARGGGRWGTEPAAAGVDDQFRHAGRNGPDGPGPGRGGRTDRAPGTGGHRRPRGRDPGHAHRPPQRLRHRSVPGQHPLFFAAS